MTELILVYMTVSSPEEARQIAHVLVGERLAACVNVLPGSQSVYRWQDRVEESGELVLIAKTRADLFNSLTERVKGLHSSSCPCIVALPLTQGSHDFLQWIEGSTLPQY